MTHELRFAFFLLAFVVVEANTDQQRQRGKARQTTTSISKPASARAANDTSISMCSKPASADNNQHQQTSISRQQPALA
jgi:hypothetical protein